MTKDPQKARAYDAVTGFFTAWRREAWDDMLMVIQTTWRAGPFDRPRLPLWRRIFGPRQPRWDPSDALRANLAHTKIRGWRIIASRRISPAVFDVMCQVSYQISGVEKSTRRMVCRVIGEVGIRQPDPLGHWGVNPTSIWRKRFNRVRETTAQP